MSQMFARFPVLGDGRLVAFVAAVSLTVVSLVASGAPAAAVGAIGGGPLHSSVVVMARPLAVAQEATPAADLEANKALARRFHDEIFEQGNLAVADEILTPDFTWHSPPQTTFVVGPEAAKQVAVDFRAFIPDLVSSDDDVIAEGDRVVIRWTSTGSAQTETGDVPVVYTGIDIFRIADGRLAELWQNTDDLGLEQQLAATSPIGTPAVATPTS